VSIKQCQPPFYSFRGWPSLLFYSIVPFHFFFGINIMVCISAMASDHPSTGGIGKSVLLVVNCFLLGLNLLFFFPPCLIVFPFSFFTSTFFFFFWKLAGESIPFFFGPFSCLFSVKNVNLQAPFLLLFFFSAHCFAISLSPKCLLSFPPAVRGMPFVPAYPCFFFP